MPPLKDPQHETFCLEYIVDFNAGKAYERAGGTGRSKRQLGHKLLTKVDIQERVKELVTLREGIIEAKVLNELAVIAFSDIRDYIVAPDGSLTLQDGVPAQAGRAVAALKQKYAYDKEGNVIGSQTEIKLWPKTDALEKIMNVLRMLVERKEVSGPDGKPIEIEDARAQISDVVTSLAAAIKAAKDPSKPE
jgi:phage terminase small subunit